MKQQAQKESVLEEIVLEGIPASPGIVIGNCAVYREQIWHPDKEIIDYKESLLMAYLAYQNLNGGENTVKSATGARKEVIAGGHYKGNLS